MSESSIHDLLGPIETKEYIPRSHSKSKHGPKELVGAADLSGLDHSTLTTIQIVDFGEVFMADNPPPTLGCPIDFFPVELCFGYPASAKSDIWQLGTLVFMTHTKGFLFPIFFTLFQHLVSFAVYYNGPIPGHWKGKFLWDKYGYTDPGKPIIKNDEWWCEDKVKEPTQSPLDSLTPRCPYLSPEQQQALERLILDMITWEPGSRLSAAEVVQRLESPVLSAGPTEEGQETNELCPGN